MARIRQSKTLKKRSIVWMSILDPRINNFKDRPVLIVSDDDGADTFDGLAITTQFSTPLKEEEVMVEDHPMTGLKRPCAALPRISPLPQVPTV